MKSNRCRHCRSPLSRPVGAARRMCWTCYRNPAIRARYPRNAPGPQPDPERELDATDLDRMIASQMKRLPRWWWADVERQRDDRRKVYVLVKCD